MRLIWCLSSIVFWLTDSTAAASRRSIKRKAYATSPPVNIISPEFPRQVVPGYSLMGVTENHRFLEHYEFPKTSFWYEQELVFGIEVMVGNDEFLDSFTPRNFSSMTERLPFGGFQLGHKIGGSTESGVFSVVGAPNYLIKYQINCIELREAQFGSNLANATVPIHPLVLDYMFLRIARSTGLVPVANFLSPPAEPCPTKSGKCSFGMTDVQFQFCKRNHASLRYMMMEKVKGTDLHMFKNKFPGGSVPVEIALIIGIAIVDGLEKLHSFARVVHGDIHLSNIIVNEINTQEDTAGIFFIDFGRGSLNGERPNTPVRNTSHWNNELFSRWELEGYVSAARDDLDRAMDVIGRLMNSWKYFEYEDEVKREGPESLREHKRESDIFWLPGLKNPVDLLPVHGNVKCLIKHELKRVVNLMKNLSDINEPLPYDAIKAAFRSCLQLIRIEPKSFELECVPS